MTDTPTPIAATTTDAPAVAPAPTSPLETAASTPDATAMALATSSPSLTARATGLIAAGWAWAMLAVGKLTSAYHFIADYTVGARHWLQVWADWIGGKLAAIAAKKWPGEATVFTTWSRRAGYAVLALLAWIGLVTADRLLFPHHLASVQGFLAPSTWQLPRFGGKTVGVPSPTAAVAPLAAPATPPPVASAPSPPPNPVSPPAASAVAPVAPPPPAVAPPSPTVVINAHPAAPKAKVHRGKPKKHAQRTKPAAVSPSPFDAFMANFK